MTPEAKQQLIVWWVLWAAFQTGIFVVFHFLGGNATHVQPPTTDSSLWLLGAVPFAISYVIRWIALPRVQSAQAALPLFIVGMMMAEVSCFLGLFLFSARKHELFLLSALGIFQFIPYFARRYFEQKQ